MLKIIDLRTKESLGFRNLENARNYFMCITGDIKITSEIELAEAIAPFGYQVLSN